MNIVVNNAHAKPVTFDQDPIWCWNLYYNGTKMGYVKTHDNHLVFDILVMFNNVYNEVKRTDIISD